MLRVSSCPRATYTPSLCVNSAVYLPRMFSVVLLHGLPIEIVKRLESAVAWAVMVPHAWLRLIASQEVKVKRRPMLYPGYRI